MYLRIIEYNFWASLKSQMVLNIMLDCLLHNFWIGDSNLK